MTPLYSHSYLVLRALKEEVSIDRLGVSRESIEVYKGVIIDITSFFNLTFEILDGLFNNDTLSLFRSDILFITSKLEGYKELDKLDSIREAINLLNSAQLKLFSAYRLLNSDKEIYSIDGQIVTNDELFIERIYEFKQLLLNANDYLG